MSTDTTVTIDEALEQVSVQRFLRAKFRLGEPSKSKAGNDKREVSLSFSVGDAWYTIYHTLYGKRLENYLDEAGHLHDTWTTVGIGGFSASSTKPEKYGKANILFFPSELAALFGSPAPVVENNEEEEDLSSHPF